RAIPGEGAASRHVQDPPTGRSAGAGRVGTPPLNRAVGRFAPFVVGAEVGTLVLKRPGFCGRMRMRFSCRMDGGVRRGGQSQTDPTLSTDVQRSTLRATCDLLRRQLGAVVLNRSGFRVRMA